MASPIVPFARLVGAKVTESRRIGLVTSDAQLAWGRGETPPCIVPLKMKPYRVMRPFALLVLGEAKSVSSHRSEFFAKGATEPVRGEHL